MFGRVVNSVSLYEPYNTLHTSLWHDSGDHDNFLNCNFINQYYFLRLIKVGDNKTCAIRAATQAFPWFATRQHTSSLQLRH